MNDKNPFDEGDLSYPAISSAIARYLDCLEAFLPHAASKLVLDQYSEHASDADRYLPEELEMERLQLHSQLRGPLPRAILGSGLVVLYSAFESTVVDAARELAKELKAASFEPSSKPAFAEQAAQHFSENYSVELFASASEKQDIEYLRLLRNSFIHKQSSFDRLPRRMQKLIREPESVLTQCSRVGDVWIPTIACIKAHGNLVRQWGHSLSGRVIGRIGFDKYL